ncbi:DUF3784 domain-containing protein [Evansella sp. AB-P1]|uniref:DUF3784 domain-containing protein n=1 Tax=Evansella sp. AB-P1 TaxID=3037653 RepID=UPI00241E4ED9|nr:DUF3784 domain-containing protein [Evansella sp. AB-P1]MDG5789231.1 DUF3784 domain-containing protein [Evansella sp. AB-P1]
MYILLFIIILFFILAIILYNGKGAFLIAGYNTLPKEEKEKYDTAALAKFMGKSMFVLTFCITLWFLSQLFVVAWLFSLGLVGFIVTILFILIYANTGNRFRK